MPDSVCDARSLPAVDGVGVVAAGGLAGFALSQSGGSENPAPIVAGALGVIAAVYGISAAYGSSKIAACEDERKELAGAEGREAATRKQRRLDADRLTEEAERAARADDCTTVRNLDPQIRELDAEVHDVVFVRDAAVARCLH